MGWRKIESPKIPNAKVCSDPPEDERDIVIIVVKNPAANMLFFVPQPLDPFTSWDHLREMECTLALADGSANFSSHHLDVTIIWKFEVVDTGHDAGQVVVRGVRWLARLANNSEHGSKSFEACRKMLANLFETKRHRGQPTTNGKLGAARNKLQEIATLLI